MRAQQIHQKFLDLSADLADIGAILHDEESLRSVDAVTQFAFEIEAWQAEYTRFVSNLTTELREKWSAR